MPPRFQAAKSRKYFPSIFPFYPPPRYLSIGRPWWGGLSIGMDRNWQGPGRPSICWSRPKSIVETSKLTWSSVIPVRRCVSKQLYRHRPPWRIAPRYGVPVKSKTPDDDAKALEEIRLERRCLNNFPQFTKVHVTLLDLLNSRTDITLVITCLLAELTQLNGLTER